MLLLQGHLPLAGLCLILSSLVLAHGHTHAKQPNATLKQETEEATIKQLVAAKFELNTTYDELLDKLASLVEHEKNADPVRQKRVNCFHSWLGQIRSLSPLLSLNSSEVFMTAYDECFSQTSTFVVATAAAAQPDESKNNNSKCAANI